MSKKSGWVPIDKCLAGTFKNINRPFSYIEAMFSYTLDCDNGKIGTYRGYAKQWQWSVGKVKRFVECLRNSGGTVVERKGNSSGTLVSFIDKGLWGLAEQKRNSSGTVAERKRVATTNPNPNPNPKTTGYSDKFLTFWEEYPKKKKKKDAYDSWVKNKCENGLFEEILFSLSQQKKEKQWLENDGKYVPFGSTWINGRRWEDEVFLSGPKQDCSQCDYRKRGYCEKDKPDCKTFISVNE